MAGLTPMMQQYFDIKAKYKDAILMFRLGDFFEMFFEDAKTAARELDIALTGRDCGQAERAPMCGVPVHAVDGYIARLVEKGYHVAMCDQVEDAKFAKGIVKRDVVRIITPGTITDVAMLDERSHNYIACIYITKKYCSLAAADITTGHFVTTCADDAQLIYDELVRLQPAQILVSESFSDRNHLEQTLNKKPTDVPEFTFNHANAYKCLTTHFGTLNLEGFGLKDDAGHIPASGALLEYLNETQKSLLTQITKLSPYEHTQYMILDSASRRNLELTHSAATGMRKGSLLDVIDDTKTAMGARMLRSWLEQPLTHTDAIKKRQDSVHEWKQMPLERAELREYLHQVHDLERIMGRLASRSANAKDMAVLRASIAFLPAIKRLLRNVQSPVNIQISNAYDDLCDIFELIESHLVENPPISTKEGKMIRKGFSAELDRLIDIQSNAQGYLAELEASEKEKTGITNLKIRYNRVFGYYIEVTASQQSKVPEHYIRKQTLANAERYFTDELKQLEEELLGAQEKIIALELEIFENLKIQILHEITRIQFVANLIATLDVLQSLSEVAERNAYIKPEITNQDGIHITDGRHPVVEKLVGHAFVPNHSVIDNQSHRLAIITGPNMAGKSTYMRQVALLVLMAQIGSFIPATEAQIGICDRIFTRVGASDDLATGQSTFMVEMTEVANILNNATKKSLVLLDEIGRGTSTFDGLAIAWSVLEYICDANKVGSKTLFATHYHELTQLEGQLDGVVNYCFTAREVGRGAKSELVFTRKLTHGGAGQSYGIHVAKLAGLPVSVLNRANDLLMALNENDLSEQDVTRLHTQAGGSASAKKNTQTIQLSQIHNQAQSGAAMAAQLESLQDLKDALDAIDINKMTPIDALLALESLKRHH